MYGNADWVALKRESVETPPTPCTWQILTTPFPQMHSFSIPFLSAFLFLGIVAERSMSYEQRPNVPFDVRKSKSFQFAVEKSFKVAGEKGSQVAIENDYLVTAFYPEDSPVWSHLQSPFDLSVAVALNSTKNITGDERDESRIKQAFKLALEMNHEEALDALFQKYEGLVKPVDTIMSVLICPGGQVDQWKLFKAIAQKGIFSNKKADLERLLLLAVKDIDDMKYRMTMIGNVIENLTVTVESVDVLRQALFTAAKLGHDWVGLKIFSKARGRFEQQDIDIAYQIASNRDKKGLLADELRYFGHEYKGELPEVEMVEGHFPVDIPADSAQSQFINALYHAGFGRLVVKLTEKNPYVLHDIVIKSTGDATATLHAALEEIASHLKDQDEQTVDLAVFIAACTEGFDDVVEAYIQDGRIKEFEELPFFKDVCFSKALTGKHKNVIANLLHAFHFDHFELNSTLMRVISSGNLDMLKCLVEAGVDLLVLTMQL